MLTFVPCASIHRYRGIGRPELVERIVRCDTDGIVTSVALQQVMADQLRARIAKAPRLQVKTALFLSIKRSHFSVSI